MAGKYRPWSISSLGTKTSKPCKAHCGYKVFEILLSLTTYHTIRTFIMNLRNTDLENMVEGENAMGMLETNLFPIMFSFYSRTNTLLSFQELKHHHITLYHTSLTFNDFEKEAY